MLIWPLCLWGAEDLRPRAPPRPATASARKEAQTLSWIQENVAAQAVVKAFGLERLSRGLFSYRRNAVLATAGAASPS
jgi:ATP-binding cassette subfamily B protein